MSRIARVLPVGVLLAGLCWLAPAVPAASSFPPGEVPTSGYPWVRASDQPAAPAAKPSVSPLPPGEGPGVRAAAQPPAEAKPQPKKELSPEMAALRDRVRRTTGAVYHQPFNTRDNNVSDIIQFCRAFGCQSEICDGGPSGPKVNGITCLCWNLPCGGGSPLLVCEGHLAARIGYGYQEVPAQLAAVLALARVPAEYPVRVAERVGTVADLVESEKLACRAGEDLSWRLIALAQYVSEPTWKNAQGEQWSVERMVREELKRLVGQVPQTEATPLLALSWTLDRRTRHNLPLDGDFLTAKKYVADCRDYVLASQNSDGSWGRASARDPASALAATAGLLEWLVLSLPKKQLEEPKIVQAVGYVDGLLAMQVNQVNLSALGSRDLAAAMAAAHALYAYDAEVFAPADPPPPAPAEKQTAAKPEKVAGKPAAE